VVNGLCFGALVMSWLRAWGIETEVDWQEDWGPEFGGENPEHLEKLDAKYYRPFGARLRRAPKGRKGYQGRVERSHRTDDDGGRVSEGCTKVAVSLQRGAATLRYGDEREESFGEATEVGLGLTGRIRVLSGGPPRGGRGDLGL